MARLSWHGYFERDADSGVGQVRWCFVVGLGVRLCLDGVCIVRETNASFLEEEKHTVSLRKCVSS